MQAISNRFYASDVKLLVRYGIIHKHVKSTDSNPNIKSTGFRKCEAKNTD